MLAACNTSKTEPATLREENPQASYQIDTVASDDAAASRAGALLDATYYRNKVQNTSAAAVLLAPALKGVSRSASAYVQAARLTVMEPTQTSDEELAIRYHALLDRALEIQPSNAKAYILKAEAFDMQSDYASERTSLDKSKALGTVDPWLLMGYARLDSKTKGRNESVGWYRQVVSGGPGNSESDRRAFVSAAVQVGQYNSGPGELSLEQLGALVWKHRNPNDAYSLGSFAQYFVIEANYDTGVVFAKEALRVMDYRVARTTLAAALYGKAAELLVAGKAAEAGRLMTEARLTDYDRDEVFKHYSGTNERTAKLLPTLRKIVL